MQWLALLHESWLYEGKGKTWYGTVQDMRRDMHEGLGQLAYWGKKYVSQDCLIMQPFTAEHRAAQQ